MVARIDATTLGLGDIVTSLPGQAHLYEIVYCGRGQGENFIKLHKAQLASDRTSCSDPHPNQLRLVLHTAAYWLLHSLRAAAPKRLAMGKGGVNTLRLRLIKIATRVRVALSLRRSIRAITLAVLSRTIFLRARTSSFVHVRHLIICLAITALQLIIS